MRFGTSMLVFGAISMLAITIGAFPVFAQPQGFKPNPLMRAALSGDDTKEAVIATAEFAPGGTTGRHTHPADEYVIVLEGTLELLVDGREPRRVSAGEAYHTAKGVIHETRNVGPGVARVSTTFITEKGQPLTQPVK